MQINSYGYSDKFSKNKTNITTRDVRLCIYKYLLKIRKMNFDREHWRNPTKLVCHCNFF